MKIEMILDDLPLRLYTSQFSLTESDFTSQSIPVLMLFATWYWWYHQNTLALKSGMKENNLKFFFIFFLVFFLVFFFIFLVFFFVFFSWHLSEGEMDRMVENRLFSHFREWKWDDTGWPPFETIYISIQSHRVGLYVTVDSSIDAFCNVILMVSSEYTCIKIRYERKQSLKFFFIFLDDLTYREVLHGDGLIRTNFIPLSWWDGLYHHSLVEKYMQQVMCVV